MQTNFSEITALFKNFKPLNEECLEKAKARDASLTKPPGSLGKLERLAFWYAAVRGETRADLNHPRIALFAGNHGIAKNHTVSAFPIDVTASMVKNFQNNGAAINQIAKIVDADFYLYEMQLETPTKDFSSEPAMSEEECAKAIAYGMMAVEDNLDVIIPGEMGIGNTSSAAAIYHALYGGEAEDWVGKGTGIDDKTYLTKTKLIGEAIKLHGAKFNGEHKALEILRHLGGFEIAAIFGLIIAARIAQIPVILDGFLSCSAAAILHDIDPSHLDHCVAGHVSHEQAHKKVLKNLGKEPILDLDMRLGEGSGGATALAILKIAIACHNGMATFEEAMVSGKIE